MNDEHDDIAYDGDSFFRGHVPMQDPQAAHGRCVSCGSSSITPPTYVTGAPHAIELRMSFRRRGAKTGFFGDANEEILVTHGRACLSCGHVMLALPPDMLDRLRAQAAQLEPVPPAV